MNGISRLANPSVFLRISGRMLPVLYVLTLALFGVGLYMAFFVAPPDYQQGETVRIMFVHVPGAWLAMFGYLLIAISAAGSLIWRHPLADVSAKAAAPIGAAFTFLALVTGALWGKPMWGAYWVWDARLTSFLVLFFLYLGLIALWVVNLPIIKFSVDWWNTLHQPSSVLRLDGPTIDPSILYPLLVMALAFTCLFVVLHLKAMRAEIFSRRINAMMVTQVERAGERAPREPYAAE